MFSFVCFRKFSSCFIRQRLAFFAMDIFLLVSSDKCLPFKGDGCPLCASEICFLPSSEILCPLLASDIFLLTSSDRCFPAVVLKPLFVGSYPLRQSLSLNTL